MISRDFILRQVHQLVQALAQVLLHRRAGQHDEAEVALEAVLGEVFGLSAEQLRALDRPQLLARCTPDGIFSSELAVALADLLREDRAMAGRERALWLYEAALASGGAVPFDVHDRIEALRASLEA